MKTLVILFALVIVTGCASFNAQVFNAEKLAADTGHAAVHSFNSYYRVVTNGMSSADLSQINQKRDVIYAYSRNLSQTLATTEALRQEYDKHRQETNKTSLLIILQTVNSQSSNLVALVKLYVAP